MVDTHAHLNFSQFDEDREEVISRFFEDGGGAIINVGVDLERSRKSIELADRYEKVYASVGLHPDYFSENLILDKVKLFPSLIETIRIPQGQTLKDSSKSNLFFGLKELAKNEKVVAIGETGLDYLRIGRSGEVNKIKERQKKGFLAQVEIARELDLPVIVHCREAWKDLYEAISSFLRFSLKNGNSTPVSSKAQPFGKGSTFPLSRLNRDNSSRLNLCGIPQGRTLTKFVLHCYSGDKKDTEKFLELPNVYFSFSGNITYPKPIEKAKRFEEIIKMIPLDKIMLDSDAPFLAPQEFRGKRNEPIFVKYIAKKIAEIKSISEEEVEKVTDENAVKFFGI